MFEMKWVIGPAEDTRWPWRPERRQKHTPLRPVCVKPVHGAGAFREVPRAPDGPAASEQDYALRVTAKDICINGK